ncbi:CsbD family protein [Myxococcus fulvus]|uniref:Uncharacterized conserved protein YjbJ, UPF0337 family n=1 Tax=Myxococcus fulvus TaxID=33 RepID=A0A511SXK1_MYXFU|nr:CsbD family protein [Myxococcus fulvus]AKF84069.1 general stress protein CsbD [Myxococcus fulvus 124B02]GEN06645.1 hypothetical protein MFU01_16820 [Myxococcus fulvus]SEU07191.1 Uncharacterized conserved protein YjbJ, UPF0337 family [Myxococcus fulvus]
MGELIDKAKGKIKETVGAATGDRSLEAEGKVDTAKGHAKEKLEDAKRAVRDAVDDDKPRRDEP